MAFVLTPEGSVSEWLADFDAWLARSPAFFTGRAVVLDLSLIAPADDAIVQLIAALQQRSIGVMGLEGVESSALGSKLPPLLNGQRSSTSIDTAMVAPPQATDASAILAAQAQKLPTSLVLDSSVRSGQAVRFPEGDLTVLGSVGSGAEVIAGGSVHVYGTLRGRVMAGSLGNQRARIFCQRLEAELLAIDGYYRSADEIDEQLRSRPVQVWLDDNAIIIRALN
jgi:septum site-determining protein MinC